MISSEHKKTFDGFINKINKDSRIGIFSDSDLDGISSAIFMEEILKNKGVTPICLDFIDYKHNIIEEIKNKILEKRLNKIIVLDFNIDNHDPIGFNEIRKECDTLLIDHHPLSKEIGSLNGIIKTKTEDCVALNLYTLGENFFERKKWKWLLGATIISEFSYLDEKNFNFLKKLYPKISKEKIIESTPAKILQKIGSLIIYHKNDLKKAHEIIKEKKIEELSEIDLIVKKEVNKYIEMFKKKAQEDKKTKIVYLFFESPLGIYNSVTTLASMKDPLKTFIGLDVYENSLVRISFRNQSGKLNMSNIVKSLLEDLEKATYGGHIKAAGGMFLKKDLDIVIKRIEALNP